MARPASARSPDKMRERAGKVAGKAAGKAKQAEALKRQLKDLWDEIQNFWSFT